MQFRVLGPVEVWADGRAVAAGHARQRAVLAVLLLDAGRAVPAEVLIDRVWGENPPRSVRNVLSGYVARLKTLVAAGGDPGVSLSRRPGGYLLQATTGQVDLGRFRRLVAEAAAAGDDQRGSLLLGEAVGLWRGAALGGLDSSWLNAMRATLELERAGAVADLSDIRLRRGEHGALAGELAAQAAESPADERLIGQLMLALYRCGRQAEALRWFDQTRHYLAGELGADPSPELRALHEQVLRADPSLAAPRYAVQVATPVPRQLPADVSAFTGRGAELAELDRLLGSPAVAAGTGLLRAGGAKPGPAREPAAVISAVSGTAGVGKTALAVHWAHRTADRFPDGQLYANLRGYDPERPVTAADALAGFLHSLGVPGQDIPPEQDQRAAMFRSLMAGRRMLIVLDNAATAEQVRPLLPGTSGCAALVTSRDALAGLVARDGATRLDLDLLPLEEAVSLLRELIGERAAADPDAAAELGRRCARLPLALRVAAELAVGRPGVPLADLVTELADHQQRLDLLDAAGDPRTAVRVVFSWSYRNLDPDTSRAFRLAGLHPGPDFDPHAAAALTATTVDQATRLLITLARAHLIHMAGSGRYAMHDLLRAYARELAATCDSDDDRHAGLTRLFDHYLHAAATAMDHLHPAEQENRPRVPTAATPGPTVTEPATAREWLDSQRANLVAVTAYAARHGWPTHATRLAATLFRYLNNGGYCLEAVAIHSHARAAARQAGDPAAEATALSNLAGVGWRQGRYQQAAEHLHEALSLSRQGGDRAGQARTLGNLGVLYKHQGRYKQAADLMRQALTLWGEVGDRTCQARQLHNLGSIEELQGRYEQAEDRQWQALAVFRETGYRPGQGRALERLGALSVRRCQYDQAKQHLNQALAVFYDTGDRTGQAEALMTLSCTDLRQGQHERAIGHLRQALALFTQMGEQPGEAQALNGLGEAFLAAGRPDEAGIQHRAALAVATQIGHKYEQARAENGLGHTYFATGTPDQARRHWQKALSLFTALDTPEAAQVGTRLNQPPDRGYTEPTPPTSERLVQR